MPVVRIRVIKPFLPPGGVGYEFHQQAADKGVGNLLGGAGEEGLGKGWEVLDGPSGCGGGFVRLC